MESPAARRLHRRVALNYRIRAGRSPGASSSRLHAWEHGAGPGTSALLALQFFVYPQLVYCARAAAPRIRSAPSSTTSTSTRRCSARGSRCSFPDLDPVRGLFGSTMLNATVLARPAQRAALGVLLLASARAWSAWCSAASLAPQTSELVSALCFAGSLAYCSAVGYVVYAQTNRLAAARDALRGSEERYRLIAENAADLDRHGRRRTGAGSTPAPRTRACSTSPTSRSAPTRSTACIPTTPSARAWRWRAPPAWASRARWAAPGRPRRPHPPVPHPPAGGGAGQAVQAAAAHLARRHRPARERGAPAARGARARGHDRGDHDHRGRRHRDHREPRVHRAHRLVARGGARPARDASCATPCSRRGSTTRSMARSSARLLVGHHLERRRRTARCTGSGAACAAVRDTERRPLITSRCSTRRARQRTLEWRPHQSRCLGVKFKALFALLAGSKLSVQ